jgi:hexosaminidase
MYKKIPSLLFALLIAATTFVHAQDADPNMGIIPVPVSVKKSVGEFILSQETKIQADTPNNKAVLSSSSSFWLTIWPTTNRLACVIQMQAQIIYLTSTGTDGLPAEGYRLTITPQANYRCRQGCGLVLWHTNAYATDAA